MEAQVDKLNITHQKRMDPLVNIESTPHALMGKYGFVTFESDVFTFDL